MFSRFNISQDIPDRTIATNINVELISQGKVVELMTLLINNSITLAPKSLMNKIKNKLFRFSYHIYL